MHGAPLAAMDYVGPALGALVFVAVMSLVAEPTRRTSTRSSLRVRAVCT